MKKAWASALGLLAIGLPVLLAGCGIVPGSGSAEALAAKKGQPVGGAGYQGVLVEGVAGPGALYALYMPTEPEWNGELVIYAHGYMDPAADVMLPSGSGEEGAVAALVAGMLPMGYGVAYSSYSENGWAVKDAITRTRQLIGLYKSRLGRPERTYIIGASMGAAVAAAMAEKCPELIDGAVAISGPLAGPIFQFEHIITTRVLFDYFYPEVIPGDAYHVPQGLTQDFVEKAALPTAFGLDGGAGLGKIAAIDQLTLPSTSGYEFAAMFAGALTFSVIGTNDVLERTHGHIPVGNEGVVYTGPLAQSELDAINAGVDRFSATPDAENYLEHWYVPTGRLRIPVVTLHNLRDPAVPYSHEAAFERIVADAGMSSLLRPYPYPLADEFGHGSVTPQEVMGAFQLMLSMIGP